MGHGHHGGFGGHHHHHHHHNHCHSNNNNAAAGALLVGAAIMANQHNQQRQREHDRLLEEERQRTYQAERRRQEEEKARVEAERQARILKIYSDAEHAMVLNEHDRASGIYESLLSEKLNDDMRYAVHEKLALIYTDKGNYLRAADHYIDIKNQSKYTSGIPKLAALMIQHVNQVLDATNSETLLTVEDCDLALAKLAEADRYAQKVDAMSTVRMQWSKLPEKRKSVTDKKVFLIDQTLSREIESILANAEQKNTDSYDGNLSTLKILSEANDKIKMLVTLPKENYQPRHDAQYVRMHQACFDVKAAQFNTEYKARIAARPVAAQSDVFEKHLQFLRQAQGVMDQVTLHVCNIRQPQLKAEWSGIADALNLAMAYCHAEINCCRLASVLASMPLINQMWLQTAWDWSVSLQKDLTQVKADAERVGGSSGRFVGQINTLLFQLGQQIFAARMSQMIQNAYAQSTQGYEVTDEDAQIIKDKISTAVNDEARLDVHDAIQHDAPANFDNDVQAVTTALKRFYTHRTAYFCCKTDVLRLDANFDRDAKADIQEAIRPMHRYQG